MKHKVPRSLLGVIALGALVSACTQDVAQGNETGPGAPPSEGPPVTPTTDPVGPVDIACGAGQVSVSAARIWRLSPRQLELSLREFFADPALAIENPLQLSPGLSHFPNAAQFYTMEELSAEQMFTLAEQLSGSHGARIASQHACLSQAVPDLACWTDVAAALQSKAFRRAQNPEEAARLGTMAHGAQAEHGKDEALRLAIELTLSSPHFLFRHELGEGTPDASGRIPLGAYELASAVSYSLTDRPPSPELLALAQNGSLLDPGVLAQQVQLLLAGEGAAEPVNRFLREYFKYEDTKLVFKDPGAFPDHDPEALIADTEAFVNRSRQQGGDLLASLFTTPDGFASARTAPAYGITASSESPQLVSFPAGQRAGILTQPSFLSAFSHNESNDPIRRGVFLREHVLCKPAPNLPFNEVPPLPELGPDATLRETLEVHRARPDCAGCHALLDNAGLGFEAYDHIGRYRTMEAGKPVDARGELVDAGDATGPFNGAIELGQKLASSETVRECVVRHGFRYVMGREEAPADACSLAAARDAFVNSGSQLGALLTSILTSDSLRYRQGATP
jgi:hypothetical protein